MFIALVIDGGVRLRMTLQIDGFYVVCQVPDDCLAVLSTADDLVMIELQLKDPTGVNAGQATAQPSSSHIPGSISDLNINVKGHLPDTHAFVI